MRKQQDIGGYYEENEAWPVAGAGARPEAPKRRPNQRAIDAALNGQVKYDPAPAARPVEQYPPIGPAYDAPGAYTYEIPVPRKRLSPRAAAWIARAAVFIVFFLNVMCAVQFILEPIGYATAYGLPATEESGAMVAGLGVAFLMWNTTYPAVIFNPRKFRSLYVVVLFQQLIGLIGESCILAHLVGAGLGGGLMAAGILRFVAFDAGGLVLMLVAFIALVRAERYANSW